MGGLKMPVESWALNIAGLLCLALSLVFTAAGEVFRPLGFFILSGVCIITALVNTIRIHID